MKVDDKGRIVLPKEFRERFGLGPGSDVVVREAGGHVVVEPADDPADVVTDIERLVAAAAESRNDPATDHDPVAEAHREAVRRGAERADDRGDGE